MTPVDQKYFISKREELGHIFAYKRFGLYFLSSNLLVETIEKRQLRTALTYNRLRVFIIAWQGGWTPFSIRSQK